MFAFATAFLTLSVCSKTSFLYPVQDWVDANCFFTTGKSMANGFVLYKDIFEQKGLLLYVIHLIGYCISNTTFIGVFLIQVIFFTVFLVFSYKSARLFTGKAQSIAILPVLSVILLTSNGYADGDSAEEFCLPLLAISLYTLLKYFTGDNFKKIPLYIMFINGALAGCVLWIKYTILGFFIGFILTVMIMCFYYKEKTYAVKCFGMFALGGIFVSAICFTYFIVTDSVSDMLETYFFINIFSYAPNSGNTNIFLKLGNIFLQMLIGMAQSIIPAILSIFGIVMFLIPKGKKYIQNKPLKKCMVFLFAVTLFFIYIGGQAWFYYYFSAGAFAVLGLIAISDLIALLWNKLRYKPHSSRIFKGFIVYPTVLLICFAIAYGISPNRKYISVKKEDTTQYVLGSVIKEKENSTLLNYGCLDGGFYTVTNKLPVTKYFCKLNIPYETYPQMLDEQNRIIKNKEVDFVVICTYKDEYAPAKDIPYLLDNYILVESCTSKTNYTGDYDLYAKK